MATKNVNPTDAESYDKRGNEYLGNREWDKAIADFTEVIRLEPERRSGYGSRGMCYAAKGDYDKAIEDFNTAIRLVPDLSGSYEVRGEAYLKKGDYDKAIEDFNEAISKNKEFFSAEPEYHDDQARLYTLRGITYAAKGDFGAAYADWETVLQMDQADRMAKILAGKVIAIVKKQQANGGKVTLAPNLVAMGILRMGKTKAVVNFIYMAIGAAAGAVIGILIGNGVLAFFLAGFLGTLKGSISNISAGSKTSAGESKTTAVLISLAASLIIAPVWFVIKFFKRIKAFFWIRSVGKRLSQKVIPDANEEVLPVMDYIDTI